MTGVPEVSYLLFEDDVVCDSKYELKPNNPTHGVGEWRVVEGSAKFEGNFATNLAQGRNVLAWVVQGSTATCFTRDEVVIINNEPTDQDDLADLVIRHDIGETLGPFVRN